MDVLLYLIPATFVLSLVGLCLFFWALSSGQYEDMDAKAEKILFDDDKKKEHGAAGED